MNCLDCLGIRQTRHAAYFVLSWPHNFDQFRDSAALARRYSPDGNKKIAPR